MQKMAALLGRVTRYLRARRARWSADSDRQFHDGIFETSAYDPFDPGYPGNITIRRFADLASEHVRHAARVADLGCGPGEITCELAGRFPSVSFTGVDHSASAVERGRELAASRGLGNVTFDRADLASLRVDPSVSLVTMFDAFHHLLDPRQFLTLNAHVPRWFLIEPAGDALGRWRYSRDFDWVLLELDKLRLRLEHELGVTSRTPNPPSAPEADSAGAVEFRYGLAEYEQLFAGYGLTVAGTVSGLMTYPPGSTSSTPFRHRFNEFAYQTLAKVDADLLAADEDLHARHWAIYCARGETFPRRRRREAPELPPAAQPLQGPYGVDYELVHGPATMSPGGKADVVVRVKNLGFLPWQSAGESPFNMSYHWRDRQGQRVVLDGLRTPLARAVASGQIVTTSVVVQAPDRAGQFVLEIELVHEGVTWFSQAGQPTLSVGVSVE